MDDVRAELERLAPGLVDDLAAVDGVVAVALGGSRARGTQAADSDWDLGLYLGGPLDQTALQAVADEHSSTPATITDRGEWGPWVDGGGWLHVDTTPVDLLYRDLERVHAVWNACLAGEVRNERQAGHPLGWFTHTYAGEVALARILHDPTGELTELQRETTDYPPALAAALVRWLWEADFSIAIARKAVARSDITYVAGCLFRAAGIVAHALHGHDRRWLLNEKGAIAAAAALPSAPADLGGRIDAVFTALAPDPAALAEACDAMAAVVDAVGAAVGGPSGSSAP